jgi:hypothetical protein
VPHTDYIITMLGGRIVERGTYEELVKNNGDFAQFISAFGGQGEQEKQEDGNVKETDAAGTPDKKRKSVTGTALMQAEERALGAVSSKVYGNYLRWAFSFFGEYFRYCTCNPCVVLPMVVSWARSYSWLSCWYKLCR